MITTRLLPAIPALSLAFLGLAPQSPAQEDSAPATSERRNPTLTGVTSTLR